MVDEETKQWLICLWYSEKDEPCARWLYSQLKSRNIRVWFGPKQLLVGDSRQQGIVEGLQDSVFLMVIISQHAIADPWVKAVLEPTIFQQVEQNKMIILPVTVDGTSLKAVSLLLQGKVSIHIPREGSEENFAELIRHLKQQLNKQGQVKLAASIEESPSRYPYGLVEDIQPDRFIVPEVTVNKITEYLVEGLSVSLVGPRMIGKSSLLNFLSSELYQNYSPRLSSMKFVTIDIQEYVTEGASALMLHLANSISQEMEEQYKATSYQGGIQWMREHIEKCSTKKGLFWIVLLDNFDSIADFKEIPATFFDDLRNLGYRYRLCYVVASRRDMKELPQLKTIKPFKASSFFTMFKKYTLGVWDSATAKKLIGMTNLFKNADVSLITQLTARHPRLLQSACEQLLEMSDRGERKDIEQFFRRYQTEADRVYDRYWEYEVTGKEREWLKKCWKVLSQTGTGVKDEVRALIVGEDNQQILEKMRQLGLILKRPGDSEQAEQGLQDTEVIVFPRGFREFLTRKL